MADVSGVVNTNDTVTIVVMGASGDLSKKKTLPSIFDLFVGELLPASLRIYGYARSAMTDDDFRKSLRPYLKGSTESVDKFLSHVFYRHGSSYNDTGAFAALVADAAAFEAAAGASSKANRIFYFAVPPSVFVEVADVVSKQGQSPNGWTRVVVEKPFGRDLDTSAQLSRELAARFSEDQIYRIDHYLGKEMVQNLMVLRFANAVFEPLWNRQHISTVQITFKEPFGVEGRGGYFDEAGIIRDVMQNHLMQVMSLVAMETPVSLGAEHVRDEKVKVLQCTAPVKLEEMVVGQYGPNAAGTKSGYHDDETIPADSATPTFATAVLHVNNARWRGVPFILKCGKALNERKAEIRIQFHATTSGLFMGGNGDGGKLGVGQASDAVGGGERPAHPNELVIRIQPNEAVYLKLMTKMPGLAATPVETELSLSYKSRYPCRPPPEAYARLLLDVLRGDQSQFVRSDELAAAWAIFTPVLKQLDAGALKPIVYPFGSRGPVQSDALIRAAGYVFEGRYAGEWKRSYDPTATGAALARVREEFGLPKPRLQAMKAAFLGEMRAGLEGKPTTIKMIPSFVTGMPSGTETGSIWAIDMGGSNLRVVEVVLSGHGVLGRGKEVKTVIPQALMHAPAPQLFDFVARTVGEALAGTGVVNPPMGFTFSFPVDQTAVDAGTLIEWTKGFSSPGTVGMDILQLLQDALQRNGVPPVRLSALVNDTVGTLLARSYMDPACRIGVILGTGTNAAYIEKAVNIPKWHGSKEGDMVINMEWGGFGSGARAATMLPLHGVDDIIDAASPNPSKQRYEKMISGMYLGELTRLLLVQLLHEGVIFHGGAAGDQCDTPSAGGGSSGLAGGKHAAPSTKGLTVPWAFTTAMMSEIAVDRSLDLSVVRRVLSRDLAVEGATLHDLQTVQEMCELVARRAARLAAVGVAAVIDQMRAHDQALGAISAGIDGSVFKKYPSFGDWMNEALGELGVECRLDTADDGSGIGAALVAFVAEHGGAVRARV